MKYMTVMNEKKTNFYHSSTTIIIIIILKTITQFETLAISNVHMCREHSELVRDLYSVLLSC